jgi:hypothetical protein
MIHFTKTGEHLMDNWREGIGRVSALAGRFADEGYMNLNKYLEAGIYSQIKRAAWEYRPKVTRQTMQTELETCMVFFSEQGAGEDFMSVLENGNQGIIEHTASDFLISEAPDVYVCRTCGQVALSSAPQRCPQCGAWPGGFRKFVAVFNMDNTEPIHPVAVIQLFASNAKDLADLVKDLPDEVLAKKPGENEWSIKDHIAHFYDAQEMLDTRLDLMLNYDDPELEAMALYEQADQEGGRPTETLDMLNKFLELRSRSITLLEELPLKDLWRTGRHAEFGRITIIRQVAYLAYHEQTHLPEIEGLREKFSID